MLFPPLIINLQNILNVKSLHSVRVSVFFLVWNDSGKLALSEIVVAYMMLRLRSLSSPGTGSCINSQHSLVKLSLCRLCLTLRMCNGALPFWRKGSKAVVTSLHLCPLGMWLEIFVHTQGLRLY